MRAGKSIFATAGRNDLQSFKGWRNARQPADLLKFLAHGAAPPRALREVGIRAEVVIVALTRPVHRRRSWPRLRLRRREFSDEAVAPAVLGVKERLHSGRELRLAVIVHDARDGVLKCHEVRALED
jgi:hypothetical protein